jgi:predicted nuclease of predicted toxin-antitoxin system
MRLLFDENLSPKLVAQIADLFPNCENALLNGLAQRGDSAIWEYARANRLTIVTTDQDFRTLLEHWGHPRKGCRSLLHNRSAATRATSIILIRARQPAIAFIQTVMSNFRRQDMDIRSALT